MIILSSCGYGIHKDLPFDSVNIGKITNKTFEHGLDYKLRESLAEAFLRNGVKISGNSGFTINGEIESFELRSLVQKDNITTSFEVVIIGKFMLVKPDGTEDTLRGAGLFPITFIQEGRLEQVLADKDKAVERAIKDIADEIVTSAIFK